MKSLSRMKMFLFAVGQFGWAVLSGLITNWLVYFYQPDTASIKAGQYQQIPQGRVILGVLTIIGAITALGRVFDAVTDPWIASLSDRCKSKYGRRIPFLRWVAFPLALCTVLVFFAPVERVSGINTVWLFTFVILYYLAITAYCTPYAALVPELGHTADERLNISTAIAIAFMLGTGLAYSAPYVWGMFEESMGRIPAMRLTFVVFAVIAFLCMLVPSFAIKEKEYVKSQPLEGTAVSSLMKTFQNKNFRCFVGSDILYWIALTMFQTGLPFFTTALLKLPETMATVYFIAMTVLSLVFYVPVNLISKKIGKKKLVMAAFGLFSIAFFFTSFFGWRLGIPELVQGLILVIVASFPMAVFSILPQAIVADIAESDAIVTKENREGMFCAARTFAFKLGQSISMLIFTAAATIGVADGTGYRIVACVAAALCLCGGVVLLLYREDEVNKILKTKDV